MPIGCGRPCNTSGASWDLEFNWDISSLKKNLPRIAVVSHSHRMWALAAEGTSFSPIILWRCADTGDSQRTQDHSGCRPRTSRSVLSSVNNQITPSGFLTHVGRTVCVLRALKRSVLFVWRFGHGLQSTLPGCDRASVRKRRLTRHSFQRPTPRSSPGDRAPNFGLQGSGFQRPLGRVCETLTNAFIMDE